MSCSHLRSKSPLSHRPFQSKITTIIFYSTALAPTLVSFVFFFQHKFYILCSFLVFPFCGQTIWLYILKIMPPICNRQPFEVRVNHIRTWLPGTRISNNKNIINKQLWCTTSFQYWKYERPISIMLAYRILISQMNDQMAIPFKSYAFALQANFLVLGYNSLFFTCSQFYAL